MIRVICDGIVLTGIPTLEEFGARDSKELMRLLLKEPMPLFLR
jgi:hypothetical protein